MNSGLYDMTKLEDVKIIGGIGSLLFLLGGLGFWGKPSLIAIVGLILMALAVKYIADETREKSIFDNFVYFLFLSVLGLIIAALIGIASLVGSMFIGRFAAILSAIVSFFFYWIILVASSLFLKRSFETIAAKTENSMFSTAGKLYFIGALTIIIMIGFLLVLVALLLTVIAFFTLKTTGTSLTS